MTRGWGEAARVKRRRYAAQRRYGGHVSNMLHRQHWYTDHTGSSRMPVLRRGLPDRLPGWLAVNG